MIEFLSPLKTSCFLEVLFKISFIRYLFFSRSRCKKNYLIQNQLLEPLISQMSKIFKRYLDRLDQEYSHIFN